MYHCTHSRFLLQDLKAPLCLEAGTEGHHLKFLGVEELRSEESACTPNPQRQGFSLCVQSKKNNCFSTFL